MNLRQRIIAGGIAAVVLPFLISGITTYFKLASSLEETSRESKEQIALAMATLFDAYLTQQLRLVTILSGDPQVIHAAETGDVAESEEVLKRIHGILGKEYDDFFFTDERGMVTATSISRDRIGIDLADRAYFLIAKSGTANISEPVVSRADGSLIVLIAAPIFTIDGVFHGIFSASIKINILMEKLSTISVGRTGYFSVVNRNGVVLVHPKNEYILSLNMYEEPGMEAVSQLVREGSRGAGEYTFRGVEKICGFAPIAITGWHVIVTQDKAEIMAPARRAYEVVLAIGAVLLLGTVTGIVLMSKRISSPVDKSMEVFRQVMLHSGDFVVTIGPDRRITSVNAAMERLTGQPAGRLIGTMPVLKNAAGVPEEEIWNTLIGGTMWSGRIRLNEGGESPITLEALIIPVKDDRGNVGSFIEIGRDITQELRIEKRLSQTQKIEAIGTLAGGIAHDFNNILGGIFGYCDLALRAVSDSAKTRKYLQEILLAAERARDLVSQIMTFSRKTDSELRPLVPKVIIKEAVKLLQAAIPKTIEIRTSIVSNASVLGDSTKIHQLLINLCTNSVHAMKDGRGVLEISLEDVFLDERAAKIYPGLKSGKHILLKVSDSGCGIRPEDMEHIFEPFFTTKPQGEGTGLGLSVVHGIVQRMGGSVSVKSEVGRGTTMSVYIPALSADAAVTPPQVIEDLPRGSGRILLVDDEAQVGRATQGILSELGYSVQPFTDSILALKRFWEEPDAFDLILVDHMMPQMTGVELAAAIKEARKDIPILLYSGYISKDLQDSCLQVGVGELLRKPYRMEELADALRRLLSPGHDRHSA